MNNLCMPSIAKEMLQQYCNQGSWILNDVWCFQVQTHLALQRSLKTNVDFCGLGDQCDQIGQFLEFLCNKFYYKSSPTDWWLFGQLWKALLLKSNWRSYFWGNFWNNLGYFTFQHLVTQIGPNQSLFTMVTKLTPARTLSQCYKQI